MGELVLAKQGIHEAFAAADRMISESIKAVTRLVVRPGLINVGLDDLMSALSTTRSRCLFGSGIAEGENRAQAALENSLSSPLLDKGSLLADASTVLVHICGGESLTLYEVELLMQELTKHVPSSAHILFGAAVVPTMGESLSVTLVSALPEDKLNPETRDSISQSKKREEISPETESAVIAAMATAELVEADEEVEEAEESEPFFDDEVTSEEPLTDEPEEEPEIVEEEEIPEPELVTEEEEVIQDETEELESEEEVDIDEPEAEEEPQNDFTPEVKERSKEAAQSELELDGGPKGKFEGENPNFHDGEDLDIPPFLRKKRRS